MFFLIATSITFFNTYAGGTNVNNFNSLNTCCDTPFQIYEVATPALVPTMSEWAMILMGVVFAGGAAVYIQRRRLAV